MFIEYVDNLFICWDWEVYEDMLEDVKQLENLRYMGDCGYTYTDICIYAQFHMVMVEVRDGLIKRKCSGQ